RRLARSLALSRAREDPRQRIRAAGTAYPCLVADSSGERMSAEVLVVNLLDVVGLDAGVGVAVERNRNGSADSGEGGPVRVRGGSTGERWRSRPVRSLMAGVLRRAGPAGVAGQTVDYRAPRTWASMTGSSLAALVSMGRRKLGRGDRRL